MKHTITLLVALLLVLPAALRADDSSKNDAAALIRARAEAAKTFRDEVSPFISTFCLRCHNDKRPSGDVTFQNVVKNPDGLAFKHLWKRAATQIAAHLMPPVGEDKQPNEVQRKVVVDWAAGMKNLVPKDPGPFVIRRLNKREYGNTLHDIFGVDPAIARITGDPVIL